MHRKVLELHIHHEAEEHAEDADDQSELEQRAAGEAEEGNAVEIGKDERRFGARFLRRCCIV